MVQADERGVIAKRLAKRCGSIRPGYPLTTGALKALLHKPSDGAEHGGMFDLCGDDVLPNRRLAKAAPLTARLTASVPLDVK